MIKDKVILAGTGDPGGGDLCRVWGVDRTGEIGTGKSDQRIGEMEEKRGEWQMKDRKWGLGEGGA